MLYFLHLEFGMVYLIFSSQKIEKLCLSIPHNCHHPHHLGWCTFFKPAYLFPQRTRKGLLLGKFIQRIKTQICTFFDEKYTKYTKQKLSTPTKILNIPNKTTSTQNKTPSMPNKTPRTPNKTPCTPNKSPSMPNKAPSIVEI